MVTAQSLVDYSNLLAQYQNRLVQWRQLTQQQLRWRARRFGSGLAESETRNFLENYALATAFHQDPRYFPADRGHSRGTRMMYAVRSVVMTRNDKGQSQFNYSKMLATVGASALAYYAYDPALNVKELATGRHMAKSIGLNLTFDAVENIVREFWPRHDSWLVLQHRSDR